jgi:hypothetical protein
VYSYVEGGGQAWVRRTVRPDRPGATQRVAELDPMPCAEAQWVWRLILHGGAQ